MPRRLGGGWVVRCAHPNPGTGAGLRVPAPGIGAGLRVSAPGTGGGSSRRSGYRCGSRSLRS
eukprot:6404758-Pyramimonas_sp.AAC.1